MSRPRSGHPWRHFGRASYALRSWNTGKSVQSFRRSTWMKLEESTTSLGIWDKWSNTGTINEMFWHVLTCFDQLRSTWWLHSLKASSKFSQIFHGTPLIKCWSSSGQHCFRLVATSCSCHRHLHVQSNNQMHSVCGHTRKHPSTWNVMKSNGEEIKGNTAALPPALNSGHLALQWAVPRLSKSCSEHVTYFHNRHFYRNNREIVSSVIEIIYGHHGHQVQVWH